MSTPTTLDPQQTLAQLAVRSAGASRVFHRHGLDFCCGGGVSLSEACSRKGLDASAVAAELQAAMAEAPSGVRWDERPLPDLVEHLLAHFHAAHREEVPRLVEMARKVEHVHGDKDACPRGLAGHLARMAKDLEEHMQKEEEVLFPMLLAGRGGVAGIPIQVMEEEHLAHGENLARLRALAHGYVPPADACNTWTALYLGLAELERDLMEHIHLENNVLFPRALRG